MRIVLLVLFIPGMRKMNMDNKFPIIPQVPIKGISTFWMASDNFGLFLSAKIQIQR